MEESLRLIKPTTALKRQYLAFYEEWIQTGEDMIPWFIKKDPTDFEKMVAFLHDSEKGEGLPPGWVADSPLWLVNQTNEIIGAVSIRHELTPLLTNSGGHIGYGIKPSARGKGYATKLLQLALQRAQELGISKALVVCDHDNIGSEKVIRKNGGIQGKDFVEDDGNIIKRFWITI
ncbi:GNAT family N-acetyltransferase [Aquibacillus kalidii]|uniref:GNAT family N-acetyltransferase n=1 Tax=Aquibacillus kalidii TaxID=2762597 RepID=UPI001646A8DB|nr:GNAT family N-acetyltransferase [Aquibacillus kalidii]